MRGLALGDLLDDAHLLGNKCGKQNRSILQYLFLRENAGR